MASNVTKHIRPFEILLPDETSHLNHVISLYTFRKAKNDPFTNWYTVALVKMEFDPRASKFLS